MVTATRTALPLLAALACGGGADRDGGRAGPPVAPAIATRADPLGRVQVAVVNGEPVYADCVAAQMKAPPGGPRTPANQSMGGAFAGGAGLDRDAALARCVDFELLAQEAEQRGLVADPDVLAARRTEMVRALVEAEFAPTLDDPSDVPAADVRWLWDTQLSRRYNRPELRRATYCRVPLDKSAATGGPEERQARELAGELHDALAGMRGLEAATFAALCAMSAGGRAVHTSAAATNPFSDNGRHQAGFYAREFAEAVFAIPAIGQISPPTRTRWGWDVLLLTDVLPAESHTMEQAAAEIREMLIHRPETADYRRRKFDAWMQRYLAAARIQLFLDNLPADRAAADLEPEPGRGGAPR
jgi:hypothetical protein